VNELSEQLPKGWEFCTLDDICVYVQRGKSPKYTEHSALPVINQKCIRWHEIQPEHLKFIHPDQWDRWSEERFLRLGDVLWNSTGTGTIGRAALFRGLEDYERCVADSHVTIVRTVHCVPEYVHFWIMSPSIQARIDSMQTGSTNQVELSKTEVLATGIPLSPLNEQKRIVAKIEALQERSRRARKALEAVPPLLEKFRQSVLAAAFRGDLTKEWREKHKGELEPASVLLDRIRKDRRKKWEEAELAKYEAKGKDSPKNWRDRYKEPEPVDASGLPELPEDWCWVRWEEVGFCQNGRAFPSKEYSTSGFKLLRPGNLHISVNVEWTESNTRYMPTQWAEQFPDYIVGANELIMNLTAQSLRDEFLGRICLTSAGEACLLNQRLARITPVLLAPEFCLFLFKSPLFRRFVDGLNTGSLIQHMFTSQVYDFVLPLPPEAAQEQITVCLRGLLNSGEVCRLLVDEQVSRFEDIEAAMLAKAFRGELVPQDPNDEPASILLECIRTDRESENGAQRIRVKKRRVRTS